MLVAAVPLNSKAGSPIFLLSSIARQTYVSTLHQGRQNLGAIVRRFPIRGCCTSRTAHEEDFGLAEAFVEKSDDFLRLPISRRKQQRERDREKHKEQREREREREKHKEHIHCTLEGTTCPIHLYQESAEYAVERLLRRRVVASARSDTFHLCAHINEFRGSCSGRGALWTICFKSRPLRIEACGTHEFLAMMLVGTPVRDTAVQYPPT